MFHEWAVFARLMGVCLWVLSGLFEWRLRIRRSMARRGNSARRRSRGGQTNNRHARNDSHRVGRGNWRWFTAGESRSASRGGRDWRSRDVGTP
jgi:hypothetical protein